MGNIKNSLYLSPDLQEFVEEECRIYGMGKSPFITMVLNQYRQQKLAVSELAKFEMYMQRMDLHIT